MVGEIEVLAEPKRKPHQNDSARDERERRHQENALDEALKDTNRARQRWRARPRPVSKQVPSPPGTKLGGGN